MNFGVSGEMIFLFLLVLILFGPKKMPEIGRQIARLLNEFRRASNEFRSQIESEVNSWMPAETRPPSGSRAFRRFRRHSDRWPTASSILHRQKSWKPSKKPMPRPPPSKPRRGSGHASGLRVPRGRGPESSRAAEFSRRSESCARCLKRPPPLP
jgi:Sec-independent protein translocase protein TatA